MSKFHHICCMFDCCLFLFWWTKIIWIQKWYRIQAFTPVNCSLSEHQINPSSFLKSLTHLSSPDDLALGTAYHEFWAGMFHLHWKIFTHLLYWRTSGKEINIPAKSVDIPKIRKNCVVKPIILRAVKHATTKLPHASPYLCNH